jgi:hypothetical protein
MRRLSSPKYKLLIKFYEEMISDPRMSVRTRNNAAEHLSRILLQSEAVAEKRAGRRDRVKLAIIAADSDRPAAADPTIAGVLSSVVGGR